MKGSHDACVISKYYSFLNVWQCFSNFPVFTLNDASNLLKQTLLIFTDYYSSECVLV